MTRRRPETPIRREGGFALVGVVMFILVLTILGLSLFSLTGYESQFMQHSMERAEAFQAAAGGLDRARFALMSTEILASVKQGLPLDGVTYAFARQGNDTTGPVHWMGPLAKDIVIRVKAEKNGETRFLEAIYSPDRARSLYRHLMALSAVDSAGLVVFRRDPVNKNPSPDEPNYRATYLSGEVWQNDLSTSSIRPLGYPEQWTSPAVTIGGVPEPELDSYFLQHFAGATEATDPGASDHYILDAASAPDQVGFFRSTWVSGDWSLNMTHPEPQVQVNGTAIWLFERGLRSERTVEVSGSGNPNDMLVLVAKKQTTDSDDPGAGIALLGSIDSPSVPVVLVSNGGVLVENRAWSQQADYDRATTVSYLSIFARYARILGPDPGPDPSTGPRLTLGHQNGDPADLLLDKLTDLGLLPNTGGGPKGKLRFLTGSWREVTEPNPN